MFSCTLQPVSAPLFRIAAALIILLSLTINLISVSTNRPLETHEVFVAQTTRQMLASGNYIIPTFGNELRLKKPPLMYWAVAATAHIDSIPHIRAAPDITPTIARIPSALSSSICVALVMFLASRLFSKSTALIAGAILTTSFGFLTYATNARPEMLYAATTLLCITPFLINATKRQHELATSRNIFLPTLGWLGLSLAILAKGPHIPAMMLVPLAAYLIITQGPKHTLKTFRPVLGLIILCAIAAPWIFAVMHAEPTAFATWKNELIGLRFGGDDDPTNLNPTRGSGGLLAYLLEVAQPKYLLLCMTMLLPWGILAIVGFFAPFAKERAVSTDPVTQSNAAKLIFVTFLGPLIALSLTPHWRDYYLLPALPLLAILIALGISDLLNKSRSNATLRRFVVVFSVLFCAGAFALIIFPWISSSNQTQPTTILLIIPLALLSIALPLTFARKLRLPIQSLAIIIPTLLIGLAFTTFTTNESLWRKRPQNVRAIGLVAFDLSKSQSKSPLPVYALGYDQDDLIYQLNRPAITLPIPTPASPLDLQSAIPDQEFVLLAPPALMQSLQASSASHTFTSVQTLPIEDKHQISIAHITRNNSSAPTKDKLR